MGIMEKAGKYVAKKVATRTAISLIGKATERHEEKLTSDINTAAQKKSVGTWFFLRTTHNSDNDIIQSCRVFDQDGILRYKSSHNHLLNLKIDIRNATNHRVLTIDEKTKSNPKAKIKFLNRKSYYELSSKEGLISVVEPRFSKAEMASHYPTNYIPKLGFSDGFSINGEFFKEFMILNKTKIVAEIKNHRRGLEHVLHICVIDPKYEAYIMASVSLICDLAGYNCVEVQ